MFYVGFYHSVISPGAKTTDSGVQRSTGARGDCLIGFPPSKS